jgi:hypothetical protein
MIRARAAIAEMPQVDSASVMLVSDDSLCHRVSAALDSGLYTTPHGVAIYLAQAGSRYIALPPSDSTTPFAVWVHVDSAFRVLGWTTAQ